MTTSNPESLPALANPALVELVPAAWGVKAPQLAEIQAYFELHPDMPEVAEAICRAVRQEFGSTAELLLKVKRDPEIDYEYLALYVRLPSYDGLLPRIHAISEAHDDLQFEKSGDILITTDCRSPQV